MVWQVGLGTGAASWVGWQHNLDEQTKDTLAEQHVADSAVNEDLEGGKKRRTKKWTRSKVEFSEEFRVNINATELK